MSKISKQFLIVTFAIMAICWGTCVICSFNKLYARDEKNMQNNKRRLQRRAK